MSQPSDRHVTPLGQQPFPSAHGTREFLTPDLLFGPYDIVKAQVIAARASTNVRLFILKSQAEFDIRAYTTQVYDDPGDLSFFPYLDSVMNGFTYPDGTGLMQLLPMNHTDNNLYIRLIHPNGTLTNFTVPPPVFNAPHYTQRAYPLNDGYAFVVQTNNGGAHGTLVDWSGQVLQLDVTLTDNPVDDYTTLAKANVNPNKDFLVATREGNAVSWKIFSAPDSSGQITLLYRGNITGNDNGDKILIDHEIFPTTEGGYGVALLKRMTTFTQNSFIDSLIEKLAKLIPIDSSRITTNRHNQPDPDAPAHQLLFPVTIKSSDDHSQRTVQQIIGDLDDLIKNKYYNSFSRENFTSHLDEQYGFSHKANLWETYKIKLIVLLASLLVLLMIYFFARWKYPEGQSFVVIKLALIVADLSLDIAFVLLSAKNVPYNVFNSSYYLQFWPGILNLNERDK
ncbi:11734_t:CDS:2 [Paraglomus brasilianum]|uniref:11734_t:CDS:1 n=1 Tax=Paraglomus brasilianum TaxID=144538 RepID=A0A9N9FRL3_9GLOM|nr:11734_t:CDS:2 [Paraglomus brasilianum]